MSSPQVITARIRGFICLNAHPVGCATNVARQIDVAKAGSPGMGIGDALVLGASSGFGLSSLLTTAFGYGARSVAVCLERPPQGAKTASAGWYNLIAARRFAKAEGRTLEVVNGDAYSNEVKAETIATLKRLNMKLDTVVYSLASPRRTDPVTGQSYTSVLKPLGQPFSSRSINLNNDQLVTVELAPASPADVAAIGGRALVSVNKALVTQASSAIPIVPLYISILYKVMKEQKTHEGTIEQIVRLYRDHLAPGVQPKVDEAGRIRIDDWELAPEVQAAVDGIWNTVTTETLFTATDYAGLKRDFRELFGFVVEGVDYSQPVDGEVA